MSNKPGMRRPLTEEILYNRLGINTTIANILGGLEEVIRLAPTPMLARIGEIEEQK